MNKAIARIAGEVCDGFHIHPFHSRAYLEQSVIPAIEDGAAAAGRMVRDITLACPVFMITGDTEDELETSRRGARRQVAFYGSTVAYRPVFDAHGWGDVNDELRALMAQGRTDDMASLITDEMLDAYAVTSSWDGLAKALLDRYGGLVDRIFPYSGTSSWREETGLLEK